MKYASLCLLAYKRPEFLKRTVNSLLTTDAGFPYELIIHDDGSSDLSLDSYLNGLAVGGNTSYVIKNVGKNRGIERALKACIGVSTGDYIFKLDSDLEFKKGWLAQAVKLLEVSNVGAVGLFDYRNQDPKDKRFHNIMRIVNLPCWESDNFVSCAYGFKRETFEKYGHLMGDDGWHLELHRRGMRLLITRPDVVKNYGFGLERSVWVGKDGKAIKTHKEPLIFER